MKILTSLILMLAFFNAKSQIANLVESKLDSNTVEVNINLNKDTINYFGDLIITIKITNKLNIDQKVLFGKFKPGQMGLWATSAIIYNTKSKKTIYPNPPNFYSSQAYRSEDLKNDYITLFKNSIIIKAFKMSDISTLKRLSNGNYQIQINYYNVLSNKVNLVVDDKFN